MLNQYLVEANYAPAKVSPDLVEKVHAFLYQLLDKSNRDFQVQMVEQIIQAYLQKGREEKADVFLRNLLTHFDRKTMTGPDALPHRRARRRM